MKFLLFQLGLVLLSLTLSHQDEVADANGEITEESTDTFEESVTEELIAVSSVNQDGVQEEAKSSDKSEDPGENVATSVDKEESDEAKVTIDVVEKSDTGSSAEETASPGQVDKQENSSSSPKSGAEDNKPSGGMSPKMNRRVARFNRPVAAILQQGKYIIEELNGRLLQDIDHVRQMLMRSRSM